MTEPQPMEAAASPDADAIDVFIGGLPADIQDEAVVQAFSAAAGACGVLSVALSRWGSGQCKGYGYVRMQDLQGAQLACNSVSEVGAPAGAGGGPGRLGTSWASSCCSSTGQQSVAASRPSLPASLNNHYPHQPHEPCGRSPATRWRHTWLPSHCLRRCCCQTRRSCCSLRQAAA